MRKQKRCFRLKPRFYRGFLLPKRRFFTMPKRRCKIAVFPLDISVCKSVPENFILFSKGYNGTLSFFVSRNGTAAYICPAFNYLICHSVSDIESRSISALIRTAAARNVIEFFVGKFAVLVQLCKRLHRLFCGQFNALGFCHGKQFFCRICCSRLF